MTFEDDGTTYAERLDYWPFTHEELQADLLAAGLEPVASTFDPDVERYLVTVAREQLERLEVAREVLVGVGDRQRPLLVLARRHEDAVVHVVEPRQVGQLVVDLRAVVAVLADRLGGEDHAALGAHADRVGGQAVLADDPLAALHQALVEPVQVRVGLAA